MSTIIAITNCVSGSLICAPHCAMLKNKQQKIGHSRTVLYTSVESQEKHQH